MVDCSSSEDLAQSRRGGLAGHHKPIRSRHQQFVSLVCRGARDQETCNGLKADTVACPSRGVATCRNTNSSEVSPSVDGRWSTFIGQCSSGHGGQLFDRLQLWA